MNTKILKGAEFEKKRSLEKKVKTFGTHHSAQTAQGATGVIDRHALEARGRALNIIEAAESEAEKIRENAKKVLDDVENAREKARQEGFAQGESKGFSLVTEALLRIEAIKEKFYKESEKEIIKLVAAVAEKVIGKLAEEHPEVIRDVVKQALEKSIGERITVRVNPQDLKRIEGEHFADILDKTKRLHFREDETVTRGGCIVETEVGTIDARIETQIEAIKKALEI